MQNQIYPYQNNFFFKVSVWLSERVQQCLIAVIEKWHQSLDSGRQAVAALTDLSKVFDCIDKELLTTKLNAYGFNNLTSFVPIPDK